MAKRFKRILYYGGLVLSGIMLVIIVCLILLIVPHEVLDQECIEVDRKVEYKQLGSSGLYIKEEQSRCIKWKY